MVKDTTENQPSILFLVRARKPVQKRKLKRDKSDNYIVHIVETKRMVTKKTK